MNERRDNEALKGLATQGESHHIGYGLRPDLDETRHLIRTTGEMEMAKNPLKALDSTTENQTEDQTNENQTEGTATDSTDQTEEGKAAITVTPLVGFFKEETVSAIKKAIGGDKLASRTVFDSLEKAVAAFTAATAVDPAVPFFRADDEAFDGMNAAVSVIGIRDKSQKADGIKAIVLFPIPSLDAFLESEKGREWLDKISDKEASHVSFRGLRNAETLEELANEFAAMPSSVEDIVTQHTRSGGLDTDTFDAVWSPLRALLKKQMAALYSAMPNQKAEVLRAIRSSKAAAQISNDLESRNLFVWLASEMIRIAENNKDENGEPAPMDTTSLRQWILERDSRDDLARSAPDLAALDAINTTLGF